MPFREADRDTAALRIKRRDARHYKVDLTISHFAATYS